MSGPIRAFRHYCCTLTRSISVPCFLFPFSYIRKNTVKAFRLQKMLPFRLPSDACNFSEYAGALSLVHSLSTRCSCTVPTSCLNLGNIDHLPGATLMLILVVIEMVTDLQQRNMSMHYSCFKPYFAAYMPVVRNRSHIPASIIQFAPQMYTTGALLWLIALVAFSTALYVCARQAWHLIVAHKWKVISSQVD